MEDMVLMAYDECGYEVRINGWNVADEIMEDSDMFEIWKSVKEEREKIPVEWHGLHWINNKEMRKYARRLWDF